MADSLSVLLPIIETPGRLNRSVHELLEVAPELAPQCEIWLIDSGAKDETPELARALARQFPQVRWLPLLGSRGSDGEAGLRLAIERSTGDFLFLPDQAGRLRLADLTKLWARRDECEWVLGRPQGAVAPGQRRPLRPVRSWTASWGQRPEQASLATMLQLFRRTALGQVTWPQDSLAGLATDLLAAGYSWEEVEVREHTITRPAPAPAPILRGWHTAISPAMAEIASPWGHG